MINKRMLIFSNQALSPESSNGRTLCSFLDIPKENLAQIYIKASNPDFSVCDNFFFASDGDVCKSVIKRKAAGNPVKNVAKRNESGNVAAVRKKMPRNSLTMLLRNFFWNRKCWRRRMNDWIQNFNPEIILLQAGDAPFVFNMAVEYADKYSIPLVIYNSENYYFKNYDYFKSGNLLATLSFRFFRRILRKSVKRAIERAHISLYASEDLKKCYDEEFNKPSDCIYTTTDVIQATEEECEPLFSYLGNLGLERHVGLIKIAKTLQKINADYKLDVYGKIPNQSVEKAFKECPAIEYKGVVSYDEVKRIMSKSLLLFHVENTDKFFCKDIRYGFSTKIADCLASGRCFVIFAPETLTCTQYVKENECGIVVSDEGDLEESLKRIIHDEDLRKKYIKNALAIAKKNHSPQKNKQKVSNIINSLN